MNAPRLEDELSLRRFVLPGLFVLALFWTLWARRPEPPQPLPSETTAPAEDMWELGGAIFGTQHRIRMLTPRMNSSTLSESPIKMRPPTAAPIAVPITKGSSMSHII